MHLPLIVTDHVHSQHINYRTSSKSCHGEILFQGPVWCDNNSRAARFQGRCLQRLILMHVHSFDNKPFVCTHNACVYTYIAGDPLLGLGTLCSKIELLCYAPMLKESCYYASQSWSLCSHYAHVSYPLTLLCDRYCVIDLVS